MPGILLYAPPRVFLAGRPRDFLEELGSPPAGGVIFEATNRYMAMEAIAAHRVALVDGAVTGEALIMLHRCMLRSRDNPAVYQGPQLFFPAYTAPPLPDGGLDARDALQAYLDATPVRLTVPACRIAVRQFQRPPPQLVRQIVPAPTFTVREPDGFDRWQRWERHLCALPDPRGLARYFHQLRARHWAGVAVHRFVSDAAAGNILAFDTRGEEIPATWWGRSSISISISAPYSFVAIGESLPSQAYVCIAPTIFPRPCWRFASSGTSTAWPRLRR